MYSTAAPAKGVASRSLRSAGLIDRDATMRDATENPGGRKGRLRSSRAPRTLEITGKAPVPPSSRMQGVRLSASTSHSAPNPSGIRSARTSAIPGRVRRNAVSVSGAGTMPSAIPVRSKPVEHWREFVQKRYNAEAKYLNLDSMLEDEVVKKYNLNPPGAGGGSARDAAVIFKLASQLTPEVETLSMASNSLTGTSLSQLSRYLPKLLNLSLQDNRIRDRKEISMIVPKKDKMIHLRELILIGNPIYKQAVSNGTLSTYRGDIARRFASLQVLDQEAIAQISFDGPTPSTSNVPVEKPSATSFPFDMGPPFVTGVEPAFVSGFLLRFFNAFDNNRAALLDAYDPSATFSFSANTSIPHRARLVGYHSSRDMPNQRKLEWGVWLDAGSRNLDRIAGYPEKTVVNLHLGAEAIVKSMASLPGTKHDLDGASEKFCLDAFPVPHGANMGLLLKVHGQFAEVQSGGIRSFDRTFMLVRAAEGSRAKTNGWDVSILSDQWTIRSYSHHDAWKPGPMVLQASTAQSRSVPAPGFSITSLPPDQQAMLATLPEAQRNLVVQVCSLTKLNVKFSFDCLTNNGWDLQRAVANFEQVKASLAQDAFL